jgi:hypothetical protein
LELEFSALSPLGREERKTMKASKFSEARAGISQATYFNWKKKYEGLAPPEMRRLKRLEDENTKLRKLAADLSLGREMLTT